MGMLSHPAWPREEDARMLNPARIITIARTNLIGWF